MFNFPGKGYKISLLIIFALLILTGAAPEKTIPLVNLHGKQYVLLDEIISALSIENSFDPVFQKGRLYYKSHYMVYKTGYSCILIDNMVAGSEYPVIRWKGGIYLPVNLAETVIETFYGKDIQIKKNKLVIVQDEPEEQKKPEKYTVPQKKEKIAFIILDPGHGGKDPGAIGKGGLKEKTITLQLSKKAETLFKKKFDGIKIKATRTTDRFIELSERAEIANRQLKKGANGIFVSIHVNASISSRISGFETYFLSQNPTNEEARKTAALENNVIILEKDSPGRKKYDDVDYIEALMMTTQIQKESSMLAASIQKSLGKHIREFKSRGVHKADFFVLRGALMPAVLVEVGFITNQKEANFLKTDKVQNKITEGIVEGVVNFINQYNKMIE
jgi:N-acetylmuramoyl-L-alanine amidase